MILDLLTSFSHRIKLDSASMTQLTSLSASNSGFSSPSSRFLAVTGRFKFPKSLLCCRERGMGSLSFQRDLISLTGPPISAAEALLPPYLLTSQSGRNIVYRSRLLESDRLFAPSEASAFTLMPKAPPPARPSSAQLPFAEVLFFRADNATD
jgi:hypothetical protein